MSVPNRPQSKPVSCPSVWQAEVLENPVKQRRRSEWAWVFFEKEIPIPRDIQVAAI